MKDNELKNKSVLIIAYYWPPYSGVAGHRWLHMSNYLEKIGYDIHVIIPDNPGYATQDEKLKEFISPKIKVTQTKNIEIRNLISKKKKSSELDNLFYKDKKTLGIFKKFMLWIRGNVFIPDARITWYLRSRKKVLEYIRSNNIDLLITTGTPHSLHLFGLFVKKRLNFKWIADFRDPWTTIEYHNEMYLSSFAKLKHKKLENKVLSSADAVTTVSNSWAEEFKLIGAKNIHVVLNGFEEKSFVNIEPQSSDKFIICHSGTLNEDRIPDNLIEVLTKLIADGKKIELHLYGNVCNKLKEKISEYKLKDYVKFFNSVSHESILDVMSKSTILLLLINKGKENSKGRIPAKIFEYIRSLKPVLLIGNTDGDASKIIYKENLGKSFEYSDSKNLYDYLLNAYNLFLEDNFKIKKIDYNKYSREFMSMKFSKLIQSI